MATDDRQIGLTQRREGAKERRQEFVVAELVRVLWVAHERKGEEREPRNARKTRKQEDERIQLVISVLWSTVK
jgi:hypothetical protein